MRTATVLLLVTSLAAAAGPKPASRPVSDVPGVDVVVDPAGRTKYQTIAAALSSLDPGGRDRVVILVRNGVYRQHLVINRPCVTLRGEDREKTRIEFPLTAGQWIDHPDDIGRGVLNLNGDDAVLEHLTVANTNTVRTHAFALYGRATRTLTRDCNFLGEGNDTVGLWPAGGGLFYHADCRFRGQIDFVCPRGWCYAKECTFDAINEKTALWHDGEKDPSKKFVLSHCKFEGVVDHAVGRYPRDAQFYFVGCQFSAFTNDVDDRNAAKTPPADFRWGRRVYFADCHRDGGDRPWHADNLATAAGSPKAAGMTAAWTFGNRWDPERTDGPTILDYAVRSPDRVVDVQFSEPITVRGMPTLVTRQGRRLPWTGSNGTAILSFAVLDPDDVPVGIDVSTASIKASLATTRDRVADLRWPATRPSLGR